MSEEEDSLVQALRAARKLPKDAPLGEKLEAIFSALLEVKGISYKISENKREMTINYIDGFGEPAVSHVALNSWPPKSKEGMFQTLHDVLEHIPDVT